LLQQFQWCQCYKNLLSLPLPQCHTMAHVIGQVKYSRFGL
jgi:hypothetical protein